MPPKGPRILSPRAYASSATPAGPDLPEVPALAGLDRERAVLERLRAELAELVPLQAVEVAEHLVLERLELAFRPLQCLLTPRRHHDDVPAPILGVTGSLDQAALLQAVEQEHAVVGIHQQHL